MVLMVTACSNGGDVKRTCKKFVMQDKHKLLRGYKACIGCLNRLEETEVIIV